MFKLGFCFACVLSFSSAFLLDSSTSLPPQNIQLITDDHYETLFRLFLDERKNRMQLQRYMEAKFDQLAKQCNSCHSVYLTPQVTKQNNETEEIAAKYQQLTLKFESMKLKFEQELATSQNKTSILEQEVKELKQVKSNDQLNTLYNINKQVQTMKADVQSIAVSNKARSQDLIAMHSDLNANKQRIIVLESNTKAIENNQSLKMANMTISVDNNQKILKALIDNNKRQIQENDEHVGITALGTEATLRSSGYQLKFNNIKSSFGISNLSSMKNNGTFLCEKKGLYLVTVTVMACSSSGTPKFEIYKNNQQFMQYNIGGSSSSNRHCNSGTGTIVVELLVNDAIKVINIDGNVDIYEVWSSFSAVKLK